jgi:MOSC domain-containing protein YiiM
VSIAIKPMDGESRPVARFARVSADRAVLVADIGLAGDRKAGTTDRHVNVMSREMLDRLQAEGCKTSPGEMGEQIVMTGIPLESLVNGSRLRLGAEAEIEIVKPRTGCARLESIQGITIKATTGRLGAMCRVTRGGPIRVGDEVWVLAPT